LTDTQPEAQLTSCAAKRSQETLRTLGLNEDCGDVLDLGCGYGTFTIPAAQICAGAVYALDIEAEMVAETKQLSEVASLCVTSASSSVTSFKTAADCRMGQSTS